MTLTQLTGREAPAALIAVLVAQLAGIDSWLAAGRDDLQAEGTASDLRL